jgi:uncharacterized membrane protein
MALLSLILGILGIIGSPFGCLCICIGPLGGLIALAAIIFGILANMQIKNAPDRFSGKGMAMAGIILGSLAIFLAIVGIIIQLVFTMKGHP